MLRDQQTFLFDARDVRRDLPGFTSKVRATLHAEPCIFDVELLIFSGQSSTRGLLNN
jgi:hypothetical protein